MSCYAVRRGRWALLVCALVVSGCVATYSNHGYVPPADELAEVVVGVDTRDTVRETIGQPSSQGVLADSNFYYVSSRVRSYGPREPQVVERNLVAITFDTAGVVQDIVQLGLEDGRIVNLDRRVTDTSVSTNTFLRQLFGNLGNFDAGTFIE